AGAGPTVNALAASTLGFVAAGAALEAAPLVTNGARGLLQAAARQVRNPALRRALGQIYRPQDAVAGGTAGLIRENLADGSWVNDAGHFMKASERIANLTNILAKGGLDSFDVAVARAVIADLSNAIGR